MDPVIPPANRDRGGGGGRSGGAEPLPRQPLRRQTRQRLVVGDPSITAPTEDNGSVARPPGSPPPLPSPPRPSPEAGVTDFRPSPASDFLPLPLPGLDDAYESSSPLPANQVLTSEERSIRFLLPLGRTRPLCEPSQLRKKKGKKKK